MSQDFMDPEIFADFIVEAKEHLETIEPTLLELEKTPDNLSLLNDIFRPMHSLKGASGFLGLNRINSLAHRAENVLDELRNDKMQVTSEIMDIILSATDTLRSMIDNLEVLGNEGEVETEGLIGQLDALLAGEVPAPAGAPAAPEAAPEAEEAAEPLPDLPPFVSESYKLTTIGESHLVDFLEEAREIVENLNGGLVKLEKDPQAAGSDLVNDLFRYFHNLKGNSGIIGYNELNALTHEAETLLGRVRKGEIEPSDRLIDVLLETVDAIDELINQIDSEKGEVTTVDTRLLLERLRRATGGEPDIQPAKAKEPVGKPAEQAAPAEADAAQGSLAENFDPEDVQVFVQAVEQQFSNMDLAFETLRKDADNADYIDGLYRSLDSLANSAGYMGFDEAKEHAGRTAGLVDQARKSDMDFSLMLDILDQECSILRDMLDKIVKELGAPAGTDGASGVAPEKDEEPKPEPVKAKAAPKAEEKVAEPAPKPAAKPAPKAAPKAAAKAQPAPQAQKPKASSTIRVDHEKLDHLMNLIGELIINRNRFAMLGRSLEEGTAEVQDVAQSLVETTYSMARISDDLQDTIMNVRMMPVGTVFTRFPRLVRDLSRKSGKQVELILEGEETELDKSVIEVIGDPLVHMIRNSVDHGLESEEVRTGQGKDPVGKVWLRAYHKGNSVAIEVEDDGKGIDPDKMRQVAVKKGVITQEQAQALDDREALELIFAPGFSSAEQITDISGRGVGMDVVRSNIKNLKGSVSVASEVGKGSKITLILPLTLAIIDALIVVVAGETFAIPLDAVSETTKIEAKRLTDVNKRKALELRGEVLGIVQLCDLLGLEREQDSRDVLPIVVIHDNERRLGLVVDRLIERQEIVIKPLGAYLTDYDIRGVSGATIMGDGSVVLILDPHEIYTMSATATRGR